MFMVGHTVAKRPRFETQIFSEACQRRIQIGRAIHLSLAGVERVVHWPELTLIGGALRGFGSAERTIAKLEQVAIDELDFTGVDVGLLDLWLGFHNVESTLCSEKIRVHHQC